MTLQKIKAAALKNFAENGYDGSSLAQIAEEVGIKKQSIYTYFKSKDMLFQTLYQDVLEQELAFMRDFLATHDDVLQRKLFALLRAWEQRFQEQVATKFFIRTSFFAPQHLEAVITKHVYVYLDALEQLFSAYFAKHPLAVRAEDAAIAYLALLDSLFVEMLYGGHARFERRLQAGWLVFWNGVSQQEVSS
ncbi:TetR/AcrR family transcriptional regulator [Lysinibacillus sp. KU-BSD001]|uniref:TetR/AcrR family transcriptional regulator n=1 Tax=Lysinibacillus sp. KU-BSD001 TaxID=3141328 RepID=UPI0036E82292